MSRFPSAGRRVAAVVAVLVCLLGGGFAAASLASAAPVRAAANFGPGTVSGALVAIRSDSPRGEYVDANGIHHCLPTGPNSTHTWAVGDYPAMAFVLADPNCDFGASTRTGVPADPTPAVKRETNVVVNVDFDSAKPITVDKLPAYRAGSPELWGDNTGSISDAAADIIVLRASTATTDCGHMDLSRLTNTVTGNNGVVGDATVAASARQVGSAAQKFCVYPRHISATTTTGGSGPAIWSEGFLAGQSYKLNVWVYAP